MFYLTRSVNFAGHFETVNMKNKQTLGIIIIAALLILGAVFYIIHQRKQMQDMVELSELNKEEMEDQSNSLINQYQEYMISINNDSLIAKLETEQVKVQRLQEELRTVKSTNTKRINELKKELETLRRIMRGYVQQIDSLNRLNERLTNENKEVKGRLRQTTQTLSEVSKAKDQLQETVTLASKLDAGNIVVKGITDKGKPTEKISKMSKIAIDFVINKNITAPPGEKTIYIRIQKPDDDVLIKSRSDVFQYENREINYSAKRAIDYGGEEYPMTIYWTIEEYLSPGTYRVDIFADGNRIGSKSFKLEK